MPALTESQKGGGAGKPSLRLSARVFPAVHIGSDTGGVRRSPARRPDAARSPCERPAPTAAVRTLPAHAGARTTGHGPPRRPRVAVTCGGLASRSSAAGLAYRRLFRPARSDLPGAQPVGRGVDVGVTGDQVTGEIDQGAVGRVDADPADEHVGHGGGTGEAGVGRGQRP